jgi:Dual specificity phosphatase, catalytic domain
MGHVHRFDRAQDGLTMKEAPVRPVAALSVSAGLSLLFVAVYGTTNWLASLRSDVPVFFFSWERSIPFVPFFSLPYLSIDLFFVAAPFICRSVAEIRTLALRIIAAIAVAGLCFVIVPLRCAFPPVTLHGWFGSVFASFLALDRPHNLLPSLHATLGLILFDLYFRRTRDVARAAIGIWFFLIALSPLLTHQHHVADIVTGMALAGYCFYVFRAERGPLNFIRPRCGLAMLYLGAAIPLFAAAAFDPRRWAVLGWVAISLVLVSAAYFGMGPRIFRKRSDGTMSLSSLFALGPCIFGQFLSLVYYRRKTSVYTRITPATLIGRRPNQQEAAELRGSGVTAVLDLGAELPEVPALRSLNYLCVPILDLTAPTPEQLDLAARFISAEAERGQVYVHCKIGYSRSAAAIAAYLLFSQQAQTVIDSIALIRRLRPGIVMSRAALKALEEFRFRMALPSKPGAFLLASSVACGS